jgi:hypothetical protein
MHFLAQGTYQTIAVLTTLQADDGSDRETIIRAAESSPDHGLALARATLDTLPDDERARLREHAERRSDERLRYVVDALTDGAARLGYPIEGQWIDTTRLPVADVLAVLACALPFNTERP